VTCYFRHLQRVFSKAGIVVTDENKRELDMTIHSLAGKPHKDCPRVWRELKKRLAADEDGFVLALKKAWKDRIGASG
jgi:hypothetical protein